MKEYVGIKQATKQGYAVMEIGGGSGLPVSYKQITARKGSGQWSDMPHYNSRKYRSV